MHKNFYVFIGTYIYYIFVTHIILYIHILYNLCNILYIIHILYIHIILFWTYLVCYILGIILNDLQIFTDLFKTLQRLLLVY